MARKSPHEHLKPEIYDLVDSGVKTSEICSVYPGIPTATVYVWVKEYKAQSSGNSRKGSENSRKESENTAKPVVAELVINNSDNHVEHLTPVDCGNIKEELRQVRRYLWRKIKSPMPVDGLAFQGANAYLKSIQIELAIPDDDPPEFTDSDRAARVAEILKSARDRRAG